MKVVYIGFGLFLLVILAFSLPFSHSAQHFDCIIQDDKIVLNNYKRDKLNLSIAIEDDFIQIWRQGQLKPYTQNRAPLSKNYYPYSEDKIIFLLFSSSSDFYFEGIVDKSCYEAF